MQSVFFKSNTLFVLLTLQIKYQGQANHDKYFHNSVDCSGYILKCISLHDWQLSPNKFTQNNLSPISHEKLPFILYEAGRYALTPLENLVEMYLSIYARKCRIKLIKILNLAKRIIRQSRSVSSCII